jgi:hypothetical protein
MRRSVEECVGGYKNPANLLRYERWVSDLSDKCYLLIITYLLASIILCIHGVTQRDTSAALLLSTNTVVIQSQFSSTTMFIINWFWDILAQLGACSLEQPEHPLTSCRAFTRPAPQECQNSVLGSGQRRKDSARQFLMCTPLCI